MLIQGLFLATKVQDPFQTKVLLKKMTVNPIIMVQFLKFKRFNNGPIFKIQTVPGTERPSPTMYKALFNFANLQRS